LRSSAGSTARGDPRQSSQIRFGLSRRQANRVPAVEAMPGCLSPEDTDVEHLFSGWAQTFHGSSGGGDRGMAYCSAAVRNAFTAAVVAVAAASL
jgi:hypothetical protein